MKCLICTQAETIDGFTSVTFERGEFRLVINNIPAWICSNCGETYVSEDVAHHLLNQTEQVFIQGIFESASEYQQ